LTGSDAPRGKGTRQVEVKETGGQTPGKSSGHRPEPVGDFGIADAICCGNSRAGQDVPYLSFSGRVLVEIGVIEDVFEQVGTIIGERDVGEQWHQGKAEVAEFLSDDCTEHGAVVVVEQRIGFGFVDYGSDGRLGQDVVDYLCD